MRNVLRKSSCRRRSLAVLVAQGLVLTCGASVLAAAAPERVIVLGLDGMDYALTRQLIDAGRLPNLEALMHAGTFAPLETSVPPQSPVAWSDFITGMDSGGHGIFDFIHRDPKTMEPYLSTSRTEPGRSLRLGSWQVPLSGGKVVLLRHGAAFWEQLGRRDIETTIVRIPANFPPAGTATRELSGMGTPDILGTYGTFTFFTADASASSETDVPGGRIVAVRPLNGAFRGELLGPDNPFHAQPQALSLDFDVFTDSEQRSAKLVLGSQEVILLEGEWSDWLPIRFPLAPLRTLPAMCRFYLKQVSPTPQLYVTPLNIDPLQPALPISSPSDWAAELAAATGRFYTQGMPEDTKAYSTGVFDAREFLAQARLTEVENLEQYRYVLGSFDRGLLFYYFGSIDQVSHMMWRPMDPGHPAYDAATDAPFADVIPALYERMDAVVGYTLAHMDSATTLFVMSDHGFASWRRSFSLNTWLREHGYLAVRDTNQTEDVPMLANIDWQRTRAYGLGLNGLYVNLRGREKAGIVPSEERKALLEEIATRLQSTIDPATGKPAVTRVYRRDQVYVSRGSLDIGPDLLVGYARGTRCSESSAVGAVPSRVFDDNRSAWSGDHCMDHTTVPGILLTNRPLRQPVHKLSELGAAILSAFDDSRNAQTTLENTNGGTR